MNRAAFTTGLVLAGILSIADIALAFTGNGEYPPRAITVTDAVLAVATIAGMAIALRGRRAGVWTVVVARALSALSAVPAFAIGDVPAPAVAGAGAVVVLTIVTVVLLAPRLRTTSVGVVGGNR